MAVPVIVHPDVELWATGYLRAALAARGEAYAAGVWVSNRVPEARSPRMVIVRRDGGPRTDVLRDAARLAVRVWGDSEQEATDLARLVSGVLAAAAGPPVVRVAVVSGPSPVADPSGQPLRFMAFEVTTRGQQ